MGTTGEGGRAVILSLLALGFLLLSSLGMPVAFAIAMTSVLVLLLDGSVPLVLAPSACSSS